MKAFKYLLNQYKHSPKCCKLVFSELIPSTKDQNRSEDSPDMYSASSNTMGVASHFALTNVVTDLDFFSSLAGGSTLLAKLITTADSVKIMLQMPVVLILLESIGSRRKLSLV